ncbi:hypothetical protein [Belliella pelovolcani]|nr:hypothetical protein [Belliella pelovolcani]
MDKFYFILIISVLFGCTSELENYQLEKSTEESILQLEIDILDGEYSFSTEERQRVIDMVFDGSTKTYIEELKKVKEILVLNPE